MKTPPALPAIFCALIALGLGAWVWQQHQEIARLLVADLGTGERAGLQRRLWEAEKRARDLEARVLAAETTHAAPAAATGAPAELPPRATTTALKTGLSVPEIMTFLNNPETLRALNAKFREQVDARYAALFKTLNLPPAQLAQLKDLLVERQAATVDVAGAALSQ